MVSLKKSTWDFYAPAYRFAMRGEKTTYRWLYDHIQHRVHDKTVLELACGPGMLAKHIAPVTKQMIATDYSEGMIAQANKQQGGDDAGDDCTVSVGDASIASYTGDICASGAGIAGYTDAGGEHDERAKLTFEVADATKLAYVDDSFDVVIIANALHTMPQPNLALQEIKRVLRPDGLLIAPNFVVASNSGFVGKLWLQFLKMVGLSFDHSWSYRAYLKFLAVHGWDCTYSKLLEGRVPLCYVECRRTYTSNSDFTNLV